MPKEKIKKLVLAYSGGDGAVKSDTGLKPGIGIRARQERRGDAGLSGLDFQSVTARGGGPAPALAVTAQGGELARALEVVVDIIDGDDVRVAPAPSGALAVKGVVICTTSVGYAAVRRHYPKRDLPGGIFAT